MEVQHRIEQYLNNAACLIDLHLAPAGVAQGNGKSNQF
jgi:hypothetical protein